MHIKNKFLLILLLLQSLISTMSFPVRNRSNSTPNLSGFHPGFPHPHAQRPLIDMPPNFPRHSNLSDSNINPFSIPAVFKLGKNLGLIPKEITEENKNRILIGAVVTVALGVTYFGYKEWQKEQITKEQLKGAKLQNDNLELQKEEKRVQHLFNLHKLQKEAGEEPDGLDTEKITTQFLGQSWKAIDQKNQVNQVTQLDDKQLAELKQKIADQVLEKLKKQNLSFGKNNPETPSFTSAS